MHKKTRPVVSNSRVYSDRGKRIGPVFSSVEKAQGYFCEFLIQRSVGINRVTKSSTMIDITLTSGRDQNQTPQTNRNEALVFYGNRHSKTVSYFSVLVDELIWRKTGLNGPKKSFLIYSLIGCALSP